VSQTHVHVLGDETSTWLAIDADRHNDSSDIGGRSFMHIFSKALGRSRALGLAVAGATLALGSGGALAATTATHRATHTRAHRTADRHRGFGPWVGSWATSPQAANDEQSPMSIAGFSDQTVRNIVYPSIGGRAARVRFSDTYGQKPLVIGSASIAVELVGAQTVPGTMHALTFNGQSSVTIPVGQEVFSDPVSMNVPAEQDLAVSVFLPDATGPATYHQEGQQDNFVSTAGNFAQDPTDTAYTTTTTSWFFADGVDVIPSNRDVVGSVVGFGDSITDGATVGTNTNDRWPNVLGNRLAGLRGRTLSVVDEGIGGNRVLNDSPCFGQSALIRFNRDVLDQSGLRDVIILEGVNDLGFSQENPATAGVFGPCFLPNTNVSAQQIINGYVQLIAAAHAHGLKIFGATITPFKDAGYWDAAAEQKRDTINNWIQTSGQFDGVVNFASVIANPYDPDIMNTIYDSGDHLHPNDAGYVAMGNSINLKMLLAK
jgi:lysophospholipase L1-like esterase